jgi:hypothetical protein
VAIFYVLSILSVLLTLFTTGVMIWFALTIGPRLRRWLDRELANDPPRSRGR